VLETHSKICTSNSWPFISEGGLSQISVFPLRDSQEPAGAALVVYWNHRRVESVAGSFWWEMIPCLGEIIRGLEVRQ
jgi:hypothetical protein